MAIISDCATEKRVKTLDKYQEKFLFGLVTVYINVEDNEAKIDPYSLTRYNQTINVLILSKVVFEFKIECNRVGSFIFGEKIIENGKLIKKYLE